MKLVFKTMPLSTNSLYAHQGLRRYMTAAGRQNKESLGWEARSQYRGDPLEGPLKVLVDLYWPDRRKHDIDNIKVLLDALTGIVWDDDGQIQVLHTSKHIDHAMPRVEMEVCEMR